MGIAGKAILDLRKVAMKLDTMEPQIVRYLSTTAWFFPFLPFLNTPRLIAGTVRYYNIVPLRSYLVLARILKASYH